MSLDFTRRDAFAAWLSDLFGGEVPSGAVGHAYNRLVCLADDESWDAHMRENIADAVSGGVKVDRIVALMAKVIERSAELRAAREVQP